MRWCGILVGFCSDQGGAKNPPKGISVKHLVLASYAQSGVGAGWGDAEASYDLRATVTAYDPVPFVMETRPCALLRGTTRDKTCKAV